MKGTATVDETIAKIIENALFAEGVRVAPANFGTHTRWYITRGNAGFNGPINNGEGYASQQAAMNAIARFEKSAAIKRAKIRAMIEGGRA
jgi:uncharacterized protein YegP (UPF0339 family)